MFSKLRLVLLVPAALLVMLGSPVSATAAAPANDNFAAAQTLSGNLPITVAGNNIDATAETGEPMAFSIPPMSSVWYRWTAPDTKTYVLDTCDDDFSGGDFVDPVLGVYSGTTFANLTTVADINGRCALRFPAVSGVTYHFQVDYYDDEGTFNLTLRSLSPPVNDNFASPTVLGPGLPVNANGTTVDATWETGEPGALGGASSSRSVWYSWTAPTSGRLRVSLCEKTRIDGPLNDTTRIYTGATLGTLNEVAALTSNDCTADFPVSAGTTYRIAVSGSIKGEFLFALGIQAAPQPANDDFTDAQAIGPDLPVNLSGNNDFATEETGEPNHDGYPNTSRSVWYRWTAPVSGPMRLKACNPDLRFYTSVYTGTTLNTLTEVSDSRNWTFCSRYFDATAGTTYRIAVAGGPFSNTHGPFALNLHRVMPPANDSFESAIDLGSAVKTSVEGTTVDATREDDEPSHSESYSGNFGGSVWYRWTAPNDKAVILSACSGGAANRITVFKDNPEADAPGTITGLRIIDSDFDSCRDGTRGGRLAIAPVAGARYFIGVTSAERDDESEFTLNVEGTATPVPKPPVTKPPVVKRPGFNLRKAVAKCKRIRGQSRRAKNRRANCIRKVRRKATVIRCKKKIRPSRQQARCIRRARQRFR